MFAIPNEITEEQRDDSRMAFYSKWQPCLRTSLLVKSYWWV